MNTTNHQDAPTITPDQLILWRKNGKGRVIIAPHYPDAKIITLKNGGAYIELAPNVETMPMPYHEATELFNRLSKKLKLRPND